MTAHVDIQWIEAVIRELRRIKATPSAPILDIEWLELRCHDTLNYSGDLASASYVELLKDVKTFADEFSNLLSDDFFNRVARRLEANTGVTTVRVAGSHSSVHAAGEAPMVSPEPIAELRASLQAMCRSSVNVADYEGPLFDVVFDIMTADSYVAGIATKILDADSIDPAECAFVCRPLLDGNAWLYEDRAFDLSMHPAVLAVARAVERTRVLCCQRITGQRSNRS